MLTTNGFRVQCIRSEKYKFEGEVVGGPVRNPVTNHLDFLVLMDDGTFAEAPCEKCVLLDKMD